MFDVLLMKLYVVYRDEWAYENEDFDGTLGKSLRSYSQPFSNRSGEKS